jgi:hypothetical protein
VWVTATGALLLFAAAATFVAVRWRELASWQKAGVLVAISATLVSAGWATRRRLPATAAATFSLGTVLVPLDAWAFAAAGSGTWQRGLLAGGLTALVAVPLGRRCFDSAALRFAGIAALPLTLGGLAAFGPVALPPAPVLVLVGIVALALPFRRAGLAWAAVGGFAPIVALAQPLLPIGRGTLADLGLAGHGTATAWATVAAGALLVVAAGLVGSVARRRDAVSLLAVLAVADVLAGVAELRLSTSTGALAGAVLFVVIEAIALAVLGDPFWSSVLRFPSGAAEVLTAVGLATWVIGGMDAQRTTASGVTLALVALGWVVADLRGSAVDGRRRPMRQIFTGDRSLLPAAGAAASTLGVVWSLRWPAVAGWCAVVAVGALWLVARRAGAPVLGSLVAGVGCVDLALVGGVGWRMVALSVAVVAFGLGARRRDRTRDAVVVTAIGSMAMLGWWAAAGLAHTVALDELSRPMSRMAPPLAAVAAVTLGVLACPRDRRGGSPLAAGLPWVTSALLLVPTVVVTGGRATSWQVVPMVAGLLVVGSLVAVAVRWQQGLPAVVATLTSPALTWAVLRPTGIEHVGIAFAAAAAGVVMVGVALVLPRIARPFLLGAAGVHALVALALCASDRGPFGAVVVATGLVAAVVGLLDGLAAVAVGGGMIAVLGSWQSLAGYGVTTPEAYLLPVAAFLLAVGHGARRGRSLSSWWTDAPAIAVLGAGALAVRVDAGPGWHALVAGGVAVAAVAVGSWRRLAGPLFGGSVLLAAVVVNETMRVSAGVPTWIWLALGGATLLGAGVSMELHGLGPIESGRRLVEVIDERFD